MKLLARIWWAILITLAIVGLVNFSSSRGQIIILPIDTNRSEFIIPINQRVNHDSIYPEYGRKILAKDYRKAANNLPSLIIGCDLPGCYPLRNSDERDIELELEFRGNEFEETLTLEFSSINLDTTIDFEVQDLVIESRTAGRQGPVFSGNKVTFNPGRYIIKNVVSNLERMTHLTPRLESKPLDDSTVYSPIYISINQRIKEEEFFKTHEYSSVNEKYELQIDVIPPLKLPCFAEFALPPTYRNALKAVSETLLETDNELVALSSSIGTLNNYPILVVRGSPNDTPLVFIDAVCSERYLCDGSVSLNANPEIYNDYQISPYSGITSYDHSSMSNVTYYYYFLGRIECTKRFIPSVHIFSQNHRMVYSPLFIKPGFFGLSGISLLPRHELPINVVISDISETPSMDIDSLKGVICEEFIIANCLLRSNRVGIKLENVSKSLIQGPLPSGSNLKLAIEQVINESAQTAGRYEHTRFYANSRIKNSISSATTFFDPDALNVFYYPYRGDFNGKYIFPNLIYLGENRNFQTLSHEIGHALSLHHVDESEFKCREDGSNSVIPSLAPDLTTLKESNIMCNSRVDNNCKSFRFAYSVGQIMKMNSNPLSAIQNLAGKNDHVSICKDYFDDFLYDINMTCPCTGLTNNQPSNIFPISTTNTSIPL